MGENTSNGQKTHTVLKNFVGRISKLEQIIDIDNPDIGNIHYLIKNIRQLRDLIGRQQEQVHKGNVIGALMEDFIKETGRWEEFDQWLKVKQKREEKEHLVSATVKADSWGEEESEFDPPGSEDGGGRR